MNVAQAALRHGVQRVVHTSTSEVYGSAQTVPITETHPLEPQSPYAASKVAADKLMDSYHRSFDLPVTVLRPFNTYGPRQSARAIIPTIISQALAGSTLRLGSLHPRRDLTFVDDTVAAFVAAATSDAAVGRTIQLGTEPRCLHRRPRRDRRRAPRTRRSRSRPIRRVCGRPTARSSA